MKVTRAALGSGAAAPRAQLRLAQSAKNFPVINSLFERMRTGNSDPFYIVNLNEIELRYKMWEKLLPRVEPFYAVKCNSDPRVVQTLASLGSKFDCASAAEMELVLGNSVSPEDIIYANPCKQDLQIQKSVDLGVHCSTVDSVNELEKLSRLNPDAKVLIRLATDDSLSVCRFSEKYGAQMDAVPHILYHAKRLGVAVVGVSYHVGSGCYSLDQYVAALRNARRVFDVAADMGMPLHMLDIGGGFPGDDVFTEEMLQSDSPQASLQSSLSNPTPASTAPADSDYEVPLAWSQVSALMGDTHQSSDTPTASLPHSGRFPQIAAAINTALDTFFPELKERTGTQPLPSEHDSHGGRERPLRVIGEPGRYFAAASHYLAVNVMGKAERGGYTDLPGVAPAGAALADLLSTGETENVGSWAVPATDKTQRSIKYYINDGLYGSFNCILYDHAHVAAVPVSSRNLEGSLEDFAISLLTTKAIGSCDIEDEQELIAQAEATDTIPSSVWGPTCDGFDCVFRRVLLPELNEGDWLLFEDMGAYTVAASSHFNGFAPPQKYYVRGSTVFDESGQVMTKSLEVDELLRRQQTRASSLE